MSLRAFVKRAERSATDCAISGFGGAPLNIAAKFSSVFGSRQLSTAGSAQAHAARCDQRRPIRGRAALAFPADVRAAGTRNSGDDHVSRQQPVTTRTALGRSVHPLRAREVHRLSNINTHTHHTSIRSITKSRAVRESLLFVVSQ